MTIKHIFIVGAGTMGNGIAQTADDGTFGFVDTLPEYGFAGLRAGDQWCLCAARFLQAHDEGCAPKVSLKATHARALDVVPLDVLRLYAV